MSVWIAGAQVAIGVGGMYMAKKASDKADATSSRAISSVEDLEEEKLDFAYEQYDEQLAQYDEWKAIYGPIEENLGEFYNNLSPEVYEAAGLEYNQQEFQKQQTQTIETLAQRGLDASGITAATGTQMGVAKAKADATIRRDAPFKVAEEKGRFLSQGKGGPTMPPTGSVGQVLAGSQLPSVYGAEADRQAAEAGSMWGSAGSILSTGLGYAARNMPTANTGTVKPQDTSFLKPVSSDVNIGL